MGSLTSRIVDGWTHYRRPGSSNEAPVLFLNGCALAAASWANVMEGLPTRDILALDRPGFASTAWSGRWPGLASEVAAVQRILTRGNPAIIVAHSMASFRAEALARLRPEMVAAIVLVDPSIESYSDRGVASRFASMTWVHSLSTVLSPKEIREFAAAVSHRGFRHQIASASELDADVFRDPYGDPETLKSAFAEWLSYRSQAADLTTLRKSTGPVRTPTSAIFATARPNRRRASLLRASFVDLERIDVADSGHLMMIDRPDAIIRAVDYQSARARHQR